ncbi:hypothetical protein JAAARDRAFT_104245, partial [Jaapia argillacea MUCL 33604]
DIVQGLNSLHSNYPPIVHGDLKPRNILVDDDGRAILSDFGPAYILGGTEFTATSLSGLCRFMAPELLPVINDDSPPPAPTFASDLWSLGCTVGEVFHSIPPSSH